MSTERTQETGSTGSATRPGAARHPVWLPGVLFCLLGMAAAMLVASLVPVVSSLLIAIVLGAVVANTMPLPAVLAPGIAMTAKRVLRIGIVLLGLKVALGDVIGLGAGVIGVVVAVVGIGIFATLWVGRLMGIPPAQRLLIGCGFSICGAAAVAAVDGTTESDDEDVATAIGLVVLFGTLMIPLVPALSSLLGLSEFQGGLWSGASVHEVAQVVAAGGIIGSGALTVAVIVKLARVLMLAPVMVVLGIQARRKALDTGSATRPPLVPLFVIGFVVMVAVNSTGVLPDGLTGVLTWLQGACLAAAMFALGLGVKVRKLLRVGFKPVVLGAITTAVVLGVGLGGTYLVT